MAAHTVVWRELSTGGKHVELRALGERDLAFWDEVRTAPADWVTDILARCVVRLGDVQPDAAVLQGLPIADRLELLLDVYEISFGGEAYVVACCPQEDCGTRMDIDFEIQELRRPGQPMGSAELDGEPYPLRWPTGEDQRLWDVSSASFVQDVLASCVSADVSQLSSEQQAMLMTKVLAAQSGPRFDLEVSCVACGRAFAVPLRLAGLFARAMGRVVEALEDDIHALASHYHWSERDILALSPERRRRYVMRIEGTWI